MFVYADNAATTKMRPSALECYVNTAKSFYGNASSLHGEGQRAKELLTDSREKIASVLNCSAREIIFTSGGSEADNQAIYSAAALGKRKGKTKIVSTAIEHHAVLHALDKLKRDGFEIELLPVDERGIVSVADANNAITPDTCLVSVMLANNEIGTLQPVAEIGAICKERGVLFHTDAVQAVGHIPVDVKQLGCDYLALSAHKFGGPKGTGALFVRTGAPLSPIIEGGAQERGKRAGTEDLPAVAAMAAALTEAVATMNEATQKTLALREKLIQGLQKIPHSSLNGDREKRLAGNVSFCFEGVCSVVVFSGDSCISTILAFAPRRARRAPPARLIRRTCCSQSGASTR